MFFYYTILAIACRKMQKDEGFMRHIIVKLVSIVSTSGFSKFENTRQLSSFFGLAPAEISSSVRGKNRITKKGNGMLRKHLFMCSFTASQTNLQCRNLYNRIVVKGKSKKMY